MHNLNMRTFIAEDDDKEEAQKRIFGTAQATFIMYTSLGFDISNISKLRRLVTLSKNKDVSSINILSDEQLTYISTQAKILYDQLVAKDQSQERAKAIAPSDDTPIEDIQTARDEERKKIKDLKDALHALEKQHEKDQRFHKLEVQAGYVIGNYDRILLSDKWPEGAQKLTLGDESPVKIIGTMSPRQLINAYGGVFVYIKSPGKTTNAIVMGYKNDQLILYMLPEQKGYKPNVENPNYAIVTPWTGRNDEQPRGTYQVILSTIRPKHLDEQFLRT